MSISAVASADLAEIRAVIAVTIRERVVRSEEDAKHIIAVIEKLLQAWESDPTESLHLKYVHDGAIVGVALVKDFRNLSTLFVAPACQRRGIGRALLEAVFRECRARSPNRVLKLNSSTVAVPFYLSLGFRQTAPSLDRPGGCVPLEHSFD